MRGHRLDDRRPEDDAFGRGTGKFLLVPVAPALLRGGLIMRRRLEDAGVAVATYPVRVVDGVARIGHS